MASPKYSFRGTGAKLLKSLALALLGAFATWMLKLTDIVDFGEWTPFIGAMLPFVVNAIKEFIKEQK